MKNKFFLMLVLIVAVVLSLTGCGTVTTDRGYTLKKTSDSQYTLTSGEDNVGEIISFPEQGKIIFKDIEYKYTFEGKKDEYILTINYPNGVETKYDYRNGVGTLYGGLETVLPDNDEFLRSTIVAVLHSKESNFDINNIIIGILLIGIGLFNFLSPRNAWYISRGWYYKNVEPSEAAISMYKFIGAAMCVIAIILMLASFL